MPYLSEYAGLLLTQKNLKLSILLILSRYMSLILKLIKTAVHQKQLRPLTLIMVGLV